MKTIDVLDKTFSLSISEESIQEAIKTIACKMNNELADKNPIFLSVLNGAFMFTSDLLKNIDIPCELAFIRLSSYEGTDTTGSVKELVGLNCAIKNRTIVIVEDIVDTGLTMQALINTLQKHEPEEIRIATMFFKPEKLTVSELQLHYVGMTIKNDFIVGYGLDYNEQGRNLREIYTLVWEKNAFFVPLFLIYNNKTND